MKRVSLLDPLLGDLSETHFSDLNRSIRYELGAAYRGIVEAKEDAGLLGGKVRMLGAKGGICVAWEVLQGERYLCRGRVGHGGYGMQEMRDGGCNVRQPNYTDDDRDYNQPVF